MNQFCAVIFDMDGLLLDSERLAYAAFRDTCEALELGELTELFEEMVGTNSALGRRILIERLRGRVEYEVFQQQWESTFESLTAQDGIPVKAGAVELLRHLQEEKIPTAIATSTSTPRALKKLGAAALLEFCKVVVGGDQVAQSKPNPEIYLRAASLLGVDPMKCLALEDSPNGVRAAVAAGMTVIQIPDLIEPSGELRELGHIILESLHEVRSFDFG